MFYGFSDKDIEDMCIDTFKEYLECISILESQKLLIDLTIADWPKLKDAKRQSLHKDIYKRAYPSEFRETKRVTLEDVARMLNGR